MTPTTERKLARKIASNLYVEFILDIGADALTKERVSRLAKNAQGKCAAYTERELLAYGKQVRKEQMNEAITVAKNCYSRGVYEQGIWRPATTMDTLLALV